MSTQRYFPNGNPDYETDWVIERNMGWIFCAVSFVGILIHHHWIEHTLIIGMSMYALGLSVGLIRLSIRGRNQAETLQEREGEIDWALDKLRDNNIEY